MFYLNGKSYRYSIPCELEPTFVSYHHVGMYLSLTYSIVNTVMLSCIVPSYIAVRVSGIYPEAADGTDVNTCCRSHKGHLMASGDDFGKVKLFSYPANQAKVRHQLPRQPSQGKTQLPRQPGQGKTQLPHQPGQGNTQLPHQPGQGKTQLSRQPSQGKTQLPRQPRSR